jgi:hypothetical protein
LYNDDHAQWISEDDMVIGTNDDGSWTDTEGGYDTSGGDYIYIVFDAEEDYSNDMDILSNSDGSELQLISAQDIYLNAGDESAEIEMSQADNAIALDADSVIVTGLFAARAAIDVDGVADFHNNVNVDLNLDVDGVTTVDSLNAAEGVDFDSTLHVDGNTDVDGNFDVDGVTTLDSLNAAEGVYFESTLEVDGTSQFNDDVNVDATLTADSATTEYHLMVQTPDMVLATVGSTIFGMPEFEVQNMNDVPVFQVDGHTEMTTVKDMTVSNSLTIASSAGLNVAGSFTAGQAITSSQAVYAGPSGTSGANGEFQDAYWPGATDYNQLVRKDYVDYHRVSETDVPQAYSYDASLITSSALDPDYNEAVYYMNGNVVLYEDSLDQDGKNYLFTVRGVNFDMIRDGNTTGLVADDEVIGYLWAENNSYELTITRVSDTELTFELGYDDINGIVACTDGVVRPTLSIGGLNNQQNMTGLTFFLDIVAEVVTP